MCDDWPIAQRLSEPNLPGDGGEVCHHAGVILHQDLAVHDAPGGGTVPVLYVINERAYNKLLDFYLDGSLNQTWEKDPK